MKLTDLFERNLVDIVKSITLDEFKQVLKDSGHPSDDVVSHEFAHMDGDDFVFWIDIRDGESFSQDCIYITTDVEDNLIKIN